MRRRHMFRVSCMHKCGGECSVFAYWGAIGAEFSSGASVGDTYALIIRCGSACALYARWGIKNVGCAVSTS